MFTAQTLYIKFDQQLKLSFIAAAVQAADSASQALDSLSV